MEILSQREIGKEENQRSVSKNQIKQVVETLRKSSLIDLGQDFYIEKFNKIENMNKYLHDWQIPLCQKVGIKIYATILHPTHMAIWIYLPQLPTKFYDWGILEKIGKKNTDFTKNQLLYLRHVNREVH